MTDQEFTQAYDELRARLGMEPWSMNDCDCEDGS